MTSGRTVGRYGSGPQQSPRATGTEYAIGSRASRVGLLQITAAAVLWGTSGVVAQLVHSSTGMGPLVTSFWRLAVSAGIMVLIALRRFGSVVTAVRRRPTALAGAGVGAAGR